MIATESRAFLDPATTADGQPRARVSPAALRTLWFNTGTLCNLACENCYIESSPKNDRLAYLSRGEVKVFLDEISATGLPVEEIGITGGEPFMNPDILGILEDCLSSGARVLVLTNAMRPMMKLKPALKALRDRFPTTFVMRVSIDHHDQRLHEAERGRRSWQPTLDGLRWLWTEEFPLLVAGRTRWNESEQELRAGFRRLFESLGVGVDAENPAELVLFPEMEAGRDVPEITTACWDVLDVNPADMMCATERMVVRRKGASAPDVVACTLLPYDDQFSLGRTLAESLRPVALNHPHCARFCVLGGGSCSG